MSEQADSAVLERVAVGLAGMSRDLLAQDSVQSTLDSIVTHAVQLVDGCEHAGVLLLDRHNRVDSAAVTGDLVRDSDAAQGEAAEGPCFDAAFRKAQSYRIADLEAEADRWPNFAPRARELGIASMMGFLLYTEEGDLGALDLYSPEPGAFTRHSELVGWLLASHAAVAFAGARTSAQLQAAIATRQEIGEAIGIIMQQHGLSADDAEALLKKISQQRNVKLREIAQTIISDCES
ncbi:GAF and ANTAR domain-containing protein [Saccharopolyspora sp. HNM0983]|uniref:GAF and ANTAR domain-containing protein n=1 Tax=Saccharopolyspora montiporae TaxID=2781240 RepID=A0A929BD86_9PSEU|nr:GAF and ANTAR domain-containing protein [Saccharopolyspora sp. HNM0983]MBE9376620.1 GAF and ANTAR domain-containing protein [Saccharopolyspora sp. HNM0983]